MTTVNSTLVDVSKLYGTKSDNLSKILKIFVGAKESFRIYKGSTLVYDKWKTTLSADDSVDIEATEYDSLDFLSIESYGKDYDNVTHNIDYTLDTNSIDKNTTDKIKEYTVKVTQDRTGENINIKLKQAANSFIKYTYSNLSILHDSYTIEQAQASGGEVGLYVDYTQVRTAHHTNGTNTSETITGNALAYITGGDILLTDTKVVDGLVSVPSAGTSPYNEPRNVYKITSYTITANGQTASRDTNILVKQEANSESSTPTSYGAWSTTVTYGSTTGTNVSLGTIGAGPGNTVKFTAQCSRTNTYTWTSGSYSYKTEYGEASVSGSGIKVSPTSISTSTTITATTYNNMESKTVDRTIIVSGQGGTSAKATVEQDAASWVFDAGENEAYQVGYQGNSSLIITGTCTCNGEEITPASASSSNTNVATVTAPSAVGNGKYKVVANVKFNSGASRSATITINSGYGHSVQTLIVQDKYPSGSGGGGDEGDEGEAPEG